MHETPQIETSRQPQSGRPWIPWMAAAAVAIALAVYVWPGVENRPTSRPREMHLPFGSVEQAYAPKVQIENLALSRAENFLHQEVTTLNGELINTGERSLKNVELTVEFSDQLSQVVLRESRIGLAAGRPPLAPGERRAFEISFEHIPVSWNRRQPEVRVTGILFHIK